MSEARTNQKWKRLCWRVLWIYAGFCTVLVTAYIALLLWCALFEKPAPLARGSEELFMSSYLSYMATEYPKRGGCFKSMAEVLCDHVAQTNINQVDLFRYLGRPDQFFVTNVIVSQAGQSPATNKIALFAYLFDRPGATNKWSVTALVSDGKVEQATLRDSKQLEREGFQPFTSDTIPASNAAALLLPKPTPQKPRLVDGKRVVNAIAKYARDVSSRERSLPLSVTLDALIQGGYLTHEDVKPLEGAEVTFFSDGDDTRPQSVLAEARMPNGEVLAILGDGSVQQFSSGRWAEIRKGLGRAGGAADGSQPSGSQTNRAIGRVALTPSR